MKERFNIIASSLSSYFGVGFNTPQEQLDIDLGKVENIFDDESQDRMDLGNAMEDGCMNYFEKKMGIKIDERNSEMKYACDGKLKCKRDGRTFLDGIETGWENKYSNASSYVFIDDLGYKIQCQAYMMAWELDQWVLSGMYCGKPVYALIKKDVELQEDIKVVVGAVYDILIGLEDIDSFPWGVIAKYSNQKQLKTVEELDDYDKSLFMEIVDLKKVEKATKERIDELQTYAKDKYDDMKYVSPDKSLTVTIATQSKKGGIDEAKLSIEHTDIDLNSYRKEDSVFKVIKTTYKPVNSAN